MRRLIFVAVSLSFLLSLLPAIAVAEPPVLNPPAQQEKVPLTTFSVSDPITLGPPTYLLIGATGGGSYSGHIVWAPVTDPNILPHGQMENTRFDLQWTGDLVLGIEGAGFLLPLASSPELVTGRMMVHLHRPLPTDMGVTPIPGVSLPLTPYTITLLLDEPVLVLPGLTTEPIVASQIQITKGKVVVFR